MPIKNTWVQKKCEEAALVGYMQQKSLISLKAKKFGICIVHHSISYLIHVYAPEFHNYDWLCHLATFCCVKSVWYKRWPSDKANRSCEIPVHKHEWGNWYCGELCISQTSWPLVISKIFVACNPTNAASSWPRTFLHPRCFWLEYHYFFLQFIGN